MYALISLSGKQVKIEEGVNTKVPLQNGKIGSKIKLENILFFDDGKNQKIGNPYIKSLSFEAEIISHEKEKKILVYKKKRRKGYEKKRGHKQQFSVIKVDTLNSKEKKKPTIAATKKKASSTTSKTKASSTTSKTKASSTTTKKKIATTKKTK